MEQAGWQVTASSYVIESPYLRVRRDRIVLPDGTVVEDYYVRESRGYVIVFALTPEREVVLVRQYKHGAGRELLELVAGMIDEDEEPLDCAIRELSEETGYASDRVKYVRSFVADPSSSNAVAHLFFAPHAAKIAEQRLDVTENITVELAALDDLRAMLQSGEIESIPHVGAIYYMLDLLDSHSI